MYAIKHKKINYGYTDLVLTFNVRSLRDTLLFQDIAGQNIPLVVSGNIKYDLPIVGEDCIIVFGR